MKYITAGRLALNTIITKADQYQLKIDSLVSLLKTIEQPQIDQEDQEEQEQQQQQVSSSSIYGNDNLNMEIKAFIL